MVHLNLSMTHYTKISHSSDNSKISLFKYVCVVYGDTHELHLKNFDKEKCDYSTR
jgi:hypothetical protein